MAARMRSRSGSAPTSNSHCVMVPFASTANAAASAAASWLASSSPRFWPRSSSEAKRAWFSWLVREVAPPSSKPSWSLAISRKIPRWIRRVLSIPIAM